MARRRREEDETLQRAVCQVSHGAPIQCCSSRRFRFGPASKQRGSTRAALCSIEEI